MIAPLIFSRDRPAQLDLLLRSLALNASSLIRDPVVLFRSTIHDYDRGYEVCISERLEARFVEEHDFEGQTRRLIQTVGAEGYFLSFCDDDVCFFDLADFAPDPIGVLLGSDDVLAFSLRLGLNTQRTYPHGDAPQPVPLTTPVGHAMTWTWAGAAGDFSYPASLDGNLWRSADVVAALEGRSFHNPNTLEDALVTGFHNHSRHRMASYYHSSVVGLPLNRVASTHNSNRVSDLSCVAPEELNFNYLQGHRIALETVRVSEVRAAHVPFQPLWCAPVPA